MFRVLLGFVFAAAVMANPVFAGGGSGGAKKDATLKIKNDLIVDGGADPTIVVIADPRASIRASMLAGTATLKQVTDEGGVVIKPGATGTLKVRAGNVDVVGAAITNSSTGKLTTGANATVPVSKGKTVTKNASAVL